MKILYYDCFAGISGDMNLAALIDAGADAGEISRELSKLGLRGWTLKTSKSSKNGIFGTRVDVELESEHHHCEHEHCEHRHEHRKFSDIKAMISASALSENVKKNALAIFEKIAEAEARVHGKSIADVAFHEVGAVDSIIDIVGCAVAYELLGIDAARSSPVELGGGSVKCAHGVLSVPAPATAILAKSFSAKIGGANHECTTPTGAAIIAAMCGGKELPRLCGKIIATGVGVGHRDCPELANILRVAIFETESDCAETETERLCEFAANIDDMPPEHVASLCSKLFEAGALDVWSESVAMKKGRLAVKVCALSKKSGAEKIAAAYFANSTTLGVRKTEVSRVSVPRESEVFESSLGKVRVKKSSFGKTPRAKPEFDDCEKIANSLGVSTMRAAEKIADEYRNRKA